MSSNSKITLFKSNVKLGGSTSTNNSNNNSNSTSSNSTFEQWIVKNTSTTEDCGDGINEDIGPGLITSSIVKFNNNNYCLFWANGADADYMTLAKIDLQTNDVRKVLYNNNTVSPSSFSSEQIYNDQYLIFSIFSMFLISQLYYD